MNPNANRPADEKRYGGLAATIWPNAAEDGHVTYNVTIARSYRLPPDERERGDNGWRDAGSLRRDDLLATAELLRWAYQRVREMEQAARVAANDEEPVS